MKRTADSSASGAFGRYQLRILATSDLHAYVMPYDYTWDQPLHSAGLARTTTLIRAARAEVQNSILVDNGDFLEGNSLADKAAEDARSDPGRCHPVIAAMNAAGYDVATLGNHDFTYGLPLLRGAIASALFPVISANVVTRLGGDPGEDQHFCPPTLFLEKLLGNGDGAQATLRIGVIGFLPPQVEIWESKHLGGQIRTRDIIETADAWVPRLRASGADIVLALCHSGLGPSVRSDRMENAAIPLAEVDGIDAIVAGHIHIPFPNADAGPWPFVDSVKGTLHGKPTVMSGFWGSHLGIIDLDLRFGPDGWSIAGFVVSTRPVAKRLPSGALQPLVSSDRAVARAVRRSHKATVAHIRRPVGKTDTALHTYFARLADCAAMQLVHDAQSDWLAAAVQGTVHEGLPILSAASPFKSGGRGGPQYFTDVPEGDILLRHIADLYVFPNSIRAVRVNGANLHDWLERSAAQFRQLVPGKTDQPLFDPDAPSYNFDVIKGISYEIDLGSPSRYDPQGDLVRPDAARIRKLRHDGAPIDPNAWFIVATNNFRANGGGSFPGLDGGKTIIEPLTLSSDVVRKYVSRMGDLRPRVCHNWRLSALTPGTGGWFDTGLNARLHLDDDLALDVQPVHDTDEGFLRCLLRF